VVASLSYDSIPHEPREWRWPGVLAYGTTTLLAGFGKSTKGLSMAGAAALTVLGLPYPGEDSDVRHAPARVLWIPGGMEDDQLADLRPRFDEALAYCAARFGLDVAEASRAVRFIHDLAEWDNGAPFALPADLGMLADEVAGLNELDAENRPPRLRDGSPNPDYAGPGPSVAVVIMDPLTGILGEGATIASVPGARSIMAKVNTFGQDAHVCPVLIAHFTASGKIAGSPAVVDAVRIALTVREEKDHPGVRILSTYAANVSDGVSVRYTVAGGGTAPFAVWLDDQAGEPGQGEPEPAPAASVPASAAGRTLRGRITQAEARQRLRETAAQRPAESAPAATDAAPWRVFRKTMGDDGPGPASYVGTSYPGPDAARQAAQADAGNGPLPWRTDDQGRHVASVADTSGQGRHRAYVAYLAGA
jgi:hypothetical protein